MVKVLITANAGNRARIFIPIADKLSEMGIKITFLSLDPILGGKASPVLKKSRHPFIEIPFLSDKSLFEMNRSERFKALRNFRKAAIEFLTTTKPDIILLGAAAYVEGVFIEEARRMAIKTVLMQDGMRIYPERNIIQNCCSWLFSKYCSLVNEWTLALYGVHYYFTPFETNRVDRILLFGNGIRQKMIRQGIKREKLVSVGNPMYDSSIPLPKDIRSKIQSYFGVDSIKPVVLFGMQCFHRHGILSQDQEVELVKNLVETFRNQTNVAFIIKLHPDNDYKLYQSKIIEWNTPNHISLVKDEMTPAELLGISSAFMTVYSTMALESLVYNVPVITLDYTPVKYHLHLEPAAFSAKKLNDLQELFKNEKWLDVLTERMKSNRDKVLDRELVNLGFSAEKAAQVIFSLSE